MRSLTGVIRMRIPVNFYQGNDNSKTTQNSSRIP